MYMYSWGDTLSNFVQGCSALSRKADPTGSKNLQKRGAKRSNFVAILVQNMGQNTHFSKNWGPKIGFC